jgi:hypothetical protein
VYFQSGDGTVMAAMHGLNVSGRVPGISRSVSFPFFDLGNIARV